MTALLVVVLLLVPGLGAYVLVLRRLRRISEAGCYWMGTVLPTEPNADAFAVAIASRLFGNGDPEFLSGKVPTEFVRSFSEHRAGIALAWVRRERGRTLRLFREYRRTVRAVSSISPTDEVKVLGDLLIFQLTSVILCLLIVVRGPSHAVRFVRWSSEVAQKLQRFVDRAVPASSATVEVIRPE